MSKYREIIIKDPVTKEETTWHVDIDELGDRETFEKKLTWVAIEGFSYPRDYEEEDIKQVFGPGNSKPISYGWNFYNDKEFEELEHMDEIPRRIRVDLFTPAEKAIYDAMQAVEDMAPDERLTDAVILLQEAQEKVADYVDEQIIKEDNV